MTKHGRPFVRKRRRKSREVSKVETDNGPRCFPRLPPLQIIGGCPASGPFHMVRLQLLFCSILLPFSQKEKKTCLKSEKMAVPASLVSSKMFFLFYVRLYINDASVFV